MGNHRPLQGAAKKEFERTIETIREREGFRQTKVLSQAPRYYLASGRLHRHKAVFKISLRTRQEDALTNEKLARETLFMQHLQSVRSPLTAIMPEVFAGGTAPRAWYIREWTAGTLQHVRNNEAAFTKSFFSRPTLRWLTKNLALLQSITARDLPQQLSTLLYQPQLPTYLWQFVEPYQRQVDSFTDAPGITARCKRVFQRATPLFRNAPRVLAHQELYPTHFIRTSSGMQIIDWENIGWALPTYDYVAVWLRAFTHPDWQQSLYRQYAKQWGEYRDATRLWYTTVFVQSVFNVVGYHYYPDKSHFRPLAEYCAGHIQEYLAKQGQ